MQTAPRKKWLRPGTQNIIKRNEEVFVFEKRDPDILDREGKLQNDGLLFLNAC
jgi:hypothetical protein